MTRPTGTNQSQVLKMLSRDDEPLRVIAHDPWKLSDRLARHIDVAGGSHACKPFVDRAFEETDTVFWPPPGDMIAESRKAP
ncbi:MAG: hypothetical protein AAGE03_15405 [Pseudomonadota bacterium]